MTQTAASKTAQPRAGWRFRLGLIGDVMFVASLFVLGGDFWDKVRCLFSYNCRVEILRK